MPALEVADIFRRHGEAYRRAHAGHLGRTERRVMAAIAACRTAALGGHVERCAECGLIRIAYNSCRNRYCPKCQGPVAVLAYLGRYTHRVAIANSRLVALAGGQVSFRWRDYRHRSKNKVMTLAADEFIRRFLLHALPDGFHRIRHYVFLANRRRTDKLALCRALLAAAGAMPPGDGRERQRLADRAPDVCPDCGGRMEPIGPFPRSPPSHASAWHDSS
jgi:hypothetical protein